MVKNIYGRMKNMVRNINIFFRQFKSEKPKKLETPLAAMLPSKYANVDVTELFPDFRPDKVSITY